MADAPKLVFGPFAAPSRGILVVFCDDGLKFGPATLKLLGPTADLVQRAAKTERFTGKTGSSLDLIHPEGLKVARLAVVGLGKTADIAPRTFIKLGGAAMGKVPTAAAEATIVAELPGGAMDAEQAADLAQGARLRAYVFDRYKTKRKDEDKAPAKRTVTIAVGDAAAVRRAYGTREAINGGVLMARDLVNEPANVLYPEEFARRVTALKKDGIDVEVLDIKAMKKLGMNALLGVGQGSARESRVVVMRWKGGKKGEAPVAFIGKGVCFDTGGISIKAAASMEDMKGDMAGAACVAGLMQALAARKAKVNAVGLVGLVENMPDGNAQRPGDIVTSMSGQTIEIINTDAEGRLVLADVVWYAAQRFKPKFMIDLATLTGAIIV
ncbi:MAG TPA: leucyl aminopeptidase, partial [Pseudolabrys sp.]